MLEVWDTPFASAKYPSVTLEPVKGKVAEVRVRIECRDASYHLEFKFAASFKCTDESVFPVDRFNQLPRSGDSCCYLWKESPWSRDFGECLAQVKAAYGCSTLRHYIILGGDNVVEVLAVGDPVVQ
jgi:hypothetical protein